MESEGEQVQTLQNIFGTGENPTYKIVKILPSKNGKKYFAICWGLNEDNSCAKCKILRFEDNMTKVYQDRKAVIPVERCIVISNEELKKELQINEESSIWNSLERIGNFCKSRANDEKLKVQKDVEKVNEVRSQLKGALKDEVLDDEQLSEFAQSVVSQSCKDDEDDEDDEDEVKSQQSDIRVKKKGKVLKFMQWNQKWLNVNRSDFDSGQCNNICKTIRNADPDVVVMEEIFNSKDDPGKNAIKKIVKRLNEMQVNKRIKDKDKGRWEGGVSAIVNKNGKERYACLYRPETVGNVSMSKVADSFGFIDGDIGTVLFQHGFFPTLDGYAVKKGYKTRQQRAGEDVRGEYERMLQGHYKKLEVGATEVDMTYSMEIFQDYKKNCKHSWHFQRGDVSYDDVGYDYCPVLFSFESAGAASSFHVLGVHGSVGDVKAAVGGKTKTYSVPEQNTIEMIYIQNFCAMAAHQGERVILLGDFNTQERSNGTMGLWDSELNLPVVSKKAWRYTEEEHLRQSREAFLRYYERAVSSRLPTNVFPFLAGLTSIPKHNDDIWVPKTAKGWKLKGGKCLEIDDFILKAWDRKTQQFYEYNQLLKYSAVASNEDDDAEDEEEIKVAEYRVQIAKEKLVDLSREDKIEEYKDKNEQYNELMSDAKAKLAEEERRLKELVDVPPSESKLRKAAAINCILAEIWSDHRPIVAKVVINPSDSNQSNGVTPLPTPDKK